MPRAIKVVDTHAQGNNLSRGALLLWVNDVLNSEFCKIDELCTGAAYCQLMDCLFPNSVNMEKIKFKTNVEVDFIDNFKILQAAFKKVSVDRTIPIHNLIKGKFKDNLEFIQWFKKFFEANYDSEKYKDGKYDASAARHGVSMGYGAREAVKARPKSGGATGSQRAPRTLSVAPKTLTRDTTVAKVFSRSKTVILERKIAAPE